MNNNYPLRARGGLTFLICMCFLCSCTNIENKEETINSDVLPEANRFYNTLTTPDETSRSLFGMSDFVMFGHNTVFSWIGAGDKEIRKISESPLMYEVQIPFWIRGQRNENAIKLRTNLVLTLAFTNDQQLQVKDYKIRDTEPLSLTTQITAWIIGAVTLTMILLFVWAIWFGATRRPHEMDLRSVIMAWIMIIVCAGGGAAYICFGSAMSVLLGIIFYFITWAGIYYILA